MNIEQIISTLKTQRIETLNLESENEDLKQIIAQIQADSEAMQGLHDLDVERYQSEISKYKAQKRKLVEFITSQNEELTFRAFLIEWYHRDLKKLESKTKRKKRYDTNLPRYYTNNIPKTVENALKRLKFDMPDEEYDIAFKSYLAYFYHNVLALADHNCEDRFKKPLLQKAFKLFMDKCRDIHWNIPNVKQLHVWQFSLFLQANNRWDSEDKIPKRIIKFCAPESRYPIAKDRRYNTHFEMMESEYMNLCGKYNFNVEHMVDPERNRIRLRLGRSLDTSE